MKFARASLLKCNSASKCVCFIDLCCTKKILKKRENNKKNPKDTFLKDLYESNLLSLAQPLCQMSSCVIAEKCLINGVSLGEQFSCPQVW